MTDETFRDKVVREVSSVVGLDGKHDIAFVGVLTSRLLDDDLLVQTYWNIADEKITDALRESIARSLLSLADMIFPGVASSDIKELRNRLQRAEGTMHNQRVTLEAYRQEYERHGETLAALRDSGDVMAMLLAGANPEAVLAWRKAQGK